MACKYQLPNSGKFISQSEFKAYLANGGLEEFYPGVDFDYNYAAQSSVETESAKQSDSQNATDQPLFSIDDIPYNVAERAYSGISFSPDKRAKSEQESYVAHMQSVYDSVIKYANTDEQKDIINAAFIAYKDGYLKRVLAHLSAKSRVLSPMISGPANFPVRRNEKANNAEHKRLTELLDFDKYGQEKLRKIALGSRPIEDVKNERLDKIIKNIASSLETIKNIDNGTERGYSRQLFVSSITGLVKRFAKNGEKEIVNKVLDFIQDYQKDLSKPLITEKNAIWPLRDLVVESAPVEEKENGVVTLKTYNGATIVNNRDLERVQILFDGKPEEKIRSVLKQNAFKWSPNNQAWQRQNTPNGIAAAKRVLDGLFEESTSNTQYSKSKNSVIDPHTEATLTKSMRGVMDGKFGKGWTDRLLGTGKVKVISSDKAEALIGKDALFHRVFHGSPHSFDKFDLAHLGSGEGAQAFGYGLYFTDSKSIAEWYREKLSPKINITDDVVTSIVDDIKNNVSKINSNDWDDAVDSINALIDDSIMMASSNPYSLVERQRMSIAALPKNINTALEWYKSGEIHNALKKVLSIIENKTKSGKLYEIELAPEQDEYLDWDKPLSEQSEKVKAAAEKFIQNNFNQAQQDKFLGKNPTGEDIYESLQMVGDKSNESFIAKQTSELMHSLGIRGIKYKAEGGKSDAYNYVVFDDNDIQIVAKYSKAGAVQAFYNPADDTSYFIADNISQKDDIYGLMLHEIGTHALQLGKDTKEFQSILKQLENMRKIGHKDVVAAFKRVPKDTKPEHIAEESLAYLIQGNANLSVVKRFVAWFKNQLRKLGVGGSWVNSLDTADLVSMANAALRSAPDSLVFDNAGETGNTVKNSSKTESLPPTITIDGKERQTTNRKRSNIKITDNENIYYDFSNDKEGIHIEDGKAVLYVGNVFKERGIFSVPDGYITRMVQDFFSPLKDNEYIRASDNPMDASYLKEGNHKGSKNHITGELENFYDKKTDKWEPGISVAKSAEFPGKYITIVSGNKAGVGTDQEPLLDLRTVKVVKEFKSYDKYSDWYQKARNKKLNEMGVDYEFYKKFAVSPKYIIKLNEPSQIKSTTGNTGAFSPSDNDIRYSRSNGFDVPEETNLQKQQRIWQDAENRWDIVQQAVIRAGGIVNKLTDVYGAMRRMPGRVAIRLELFQEKVWEPLLKRVADQDTNLDDLALYLYAKHAEERNKRIAKINKRFDDGGSGIKTAEAAGYLAELKQQYGAKFAEFEKLAKDFQAITGATLSMLEHSGVMSPEQVAAYRNSYKNYVPLKGFEAADEAGKPTQGNGTGMGHSTARNFSRRALGRQSRAGQIIENILRDHERAIMFVEKASIGKTVRALVEANPNPELWEVNNIPLQQVYTPSPEPDGMVILRKAQFDPEKEIQYVENGQVVRIQLHDPVLLRAYNRLGDYGIENVVLKAGASMNRFLREMWTAKNPAFFLINPIRDIQQATVFLTGEGGGGLAVKSMAHWNGARKAMLAQARKQQAPNGWQQWVDRYREAGGHTGTAYVGSLEQMTEKLNNHLSRLQSKSFSNMTPWEKAKSLAFRTFNNSLFDYIEHMNQSLENATRLAAFRASVEHGLSDEEAGRIAKNVSIDFNKRGEMGSALSAAYLFSNANIQGTANLLKTLTESNHKGQAWGVVGGLVTAGLLMGLLRDDDDDDLIPDYEKERNLILPTGEDSYVTIPLAYGWSWFMDVGRAASDVIKGKDSNKVGMGLASSFFGNFSPIGNPIPEGKADSKTFIVQIAPTSAKPLLMSGLNVNSFGSPLMPESPYKLDQPDSQKAFRKTRGTVYDYTAKALNSFSGGDVARKGWMDVSPETLKNTVNYIAGGAGRFLTDTASMGSTALSADEPNKPETWPILKAFYKKQDIDDVRRQFYELSREVSVAKEYQRAYLKAKDMEGLRAFNKEYGRLAGLDHQARSLNEQLRSMRDRQDAIRNGNSPNKRAILAQLEKQESDMLTRFNKLVPN